VVLQFELKMKVKLKKPWLAGMSVSSRRSNGHLVCRPENDVPSDDSEIHSTAGLPTPKQPEWYKTRNLSDLESAERYFLGWCRHAWQGYPLIIRR
jgi:hypothetical protein